MKISFANFDNPESTLVELDYSANLCETNCELNNVLYISKKRDIFFSPNLYLPRSLPI